MDQTRRTRSRAVALVALAGTVCALPLAHAGDTCGYDLTSPDAVYTLPEPLIEISALAYIDPLTLVCIQDEQGILYTYNPASDMLTTQVVFGGDGDYEGIARVEQTMYVLRSDGHLLEITGCSSGTSEVQIHETGIPAKNSEGLCYDAAGNRLLIAAKSKSGKGSEFRDKRMVYDFDLGTKSLREEPALTLDLQEITRLGREAGVQMPEHEKKDHTSTSIVKLKPSAIAVHPSTGHLYLLSGSNHLLSLPPLFGQFC